VNAQTHSVRRAHREADRPAGKAGRKPNVTSNERALPPTTEKSSKEKRSPSHGRPKDGGGSPLPAADGQSGGNKSAAKGEPSGSTEPTKPSIPTISIGDGGMSTYLEAKRICSNQRMLDLVPPEQRDAEFLAGNLSKVVPPEQKQPAYDGCLAGLHSLGL
jgi:hypothetical protein